MFPFIYFAAFFFGITFLFSSILKNKKFDKKIISFSLFLLLLLLWTMVVYSLDNIDISNNARVVLNHFEMIFMLSFAPLYLLFIYFLVDSKLNKLFWGSVTINYAAIIARYLLPMDTSQPNFWRINDPQIAMIFATAFTIPMVTAIYIIISKYIKENDKMIKRNLAGNLLGISIATVLSLMSEFIIPVILKIQLEIPLINIALLIFVIFIYNALINHGFLESNLGKIYEGVFNESSTGVVLLDDNFSIVRYNKAFSDLLSSDIDLKGTLFKDCVVDFESDRKEINNGVFTLINNNKVTITSNQLNNNLYNTVVTVSNFNDINTKIEHIELETMTDYLTRIPNRKSFFIDAYKLVKHNDYSLIMIDLNNFKKINDVYGHDTGDQVLIGFSKKLIMCSTSGRVYRLGGDEFAVLLPIDSKVDFAEKAIRINEYLSSFDKDLSVAYGSATLTKENTNESNKVEELMKMADRKMYKHKQDTKKDN